MERFKVPERAEVSATNQAIFDKLKVNLGMVPNLYAYFAKNETALEDYLTLQSRKGVLNPKEREVINLVVSQVNNCKYCLAAHTAVSGMLGFSSEQIIQIRLAEVSFDSKLDALAKFVKDTTISRGKPGTEITDRLFAAGYNEESLVDIVIGVGDKTISNYLHGITDLPVDFPLAPEL